MTLNPEHGIAAFTDGSAYNKDGSGGWAWVAVDAFGGIDSDSGCASQTTNNQMELQAVGRAVHDIQYDLEENQGIDPQTVDLLVYSDSEYVVLGLNDKTRKRSKNRDYWKAAEQYIGNYNSVTFEHIRGHAGHKYNELADKLAGEARKKGKESRSNADRDNTEG